MNNNDLIYQIKHLPPDRFLAPARNGGYICTICGNGSGESDTGIIPKSESDGYKYYCHNEGKFLNNLELLAGYYKLDLHSDFAEICKRAAAQFGLNGGNFQMTKAAENKTTPKRSFEELKLIQRDITLAQEHLNKLPLDDNGTWRGLTLDTLRFFHCGYFASWTSITNRLNKRKTALTPRLIIPCGNHYLARLIVLIENYASAPDKNYIREKTHEGDKVPFAAEFITAATQTVVIVEGEIDAMSINQVFGVVSGNTARIAVATLGANTGETIKQEIFNTLETIFADKEKKPDILILYDNDRAGQINAPKLRKYFIERGYPAVYDFFFG